MVKKNKRKFNDLITLRKVGYGKVSFVDYSFAIDKDYRARVELGIGNEVNYDIIVSDRVQLGEDEKIIVDTFIDNFIKSKKDKVPLSDVDVEEHYEYEELLYDNIIIEDEQLNNKYRTIIDFIQSEHEEINADNVTKMYNMMTGEVTSRKK